MLLYDRDIAIILRRAKKVMWTGERENFDHKHQFLCIAVNAVSPSATGLRAGIGGRVCNIIEARLNPHYSFFSWLATAIGNPTGVGLDPLEVQRHKMEWVDMLIAEFSAFPHKCRIVS